MGAVWGSLAAMGIGMSELFGRRVVSGSAAITAAFVIQLIAALASLVSVWFFASEFAAGDMAWGAASGLGIAAGTGCYFGALNRSSATVVAPTVATLSAVIPFVYTIVRGAELSSIAIGGAVVAFIGLAIIAAGAGGATNLRPGLLWGALSGLGYGFGISMLVEVSDEAGVWPAVSLRLVAAVILGTAAGVTRSQLWPPPGLRLSGLASGTFAGAASVCALIGLSISAAPTVVTQSMFPVASVLVGFFYFGDAVLRRQVGGIFLALAGIAAVVAA